VTLAEEIPTTASIKVSCVVRIPNMEVKATHEDLIIGWFEAKLGFARYADMIHALFHGEVEAFTAELNNYLQEVTSVRQVGPHRAEQFYHGFMLGLLVVMRKEYSINSEIESGQGYVDTLAIPRAGTGSMAVVLEYKVANSQEELATKVEQALEQISSKDYPARVRAYKHIQQVVKIGVAFYRKEALVKREIVNLA